MKYNKLIASLLAAAMSLSLLGTAALAADEVPEELPAVVETSAVEDTDAVIETAPVEETVPVTESKPVEETAPAEEQSEAPETEADLLTMDKPEDQPQHKITFGSNYGIDGPECTYGPYDGAGENDSTKSGNQEITTGQYWNEGASVSVSYSIHPDYHVVAITLNGVNYPKYMWGYHTDTGELKVNVYPLMEDTFIYVVLAKNDAAINYTVTASGDDHAKIVRITDGSKDPNMGKFPTDKLEVEENKFVTVDFKADKGYHISEVLVDGVSYTDSEEGGDFALTLGKTGGSVEFPLILANHDVQVVSGQDEATIQTVNYTVQHIYSTGYTYADALDNGSVTEVQRLTAQVGQQNLAPIQAKRGFELTPHNSIIYNSEENQPEHTVGDDGAYTFTGVKDKVVVTYHYFKAVPVKVDFQLDENSDEETLYDVYYHNPMSDEAVPQGLGEDQPIPETRRAGYLFLGWKSDLDKKVYQTEDVAGMTFACDVTFTAQWVPVTTVSIYHYYEKNGGYVADERNSDTDAVSFRQDGQDGKAVTADFIAGLVQSADQTPEARYQYVGYEVVTITDGWNDPIYDLKGDLDLTGLNEVRIHLIYDPYYTVATSADEFSAITPTGSYKHGENVELEATAQEGYHIASVILDGENVTLNDGKFTIPAIDADHTVAVTAAKDEVVVPPDNNDNNHGGSEDNDHNNSGNNNSDNDNNSGGSTPDPKPTVPVVPEDEVEIADPETPLAPLPEVPLQPDVPVAEDEITIDEPDVPLGGLPTVEIDTATGTVDTAITTDTDTETDITIGDAVTIADEHIPMGNLPQTGTLGGSSIGSSRALAFAALTGAAFSAGMAGALLLIRKKDSED